MRMYLQRRQFCQISKCVVRQHVDLIVAQIAARIERKGRVRCGHRMIIGKCQAEHLQPGQRFQMADTILVYHRDFV